MVRIVLALAVVVAFACGGARPEPSNQAPPSGAGVATSDILGYLPGDSEIVVGIDFRLLHNSPLWHEYRPVFAEALGVAEVTSSCGFDPLETIETLVVAGPDKDNLVAVVRGWDRDLSIACVRAPKTGDDVLTVDRDVITLTRKDGSRSVASFVDQTTVVIDASKHPSERQLREILGRGAPLRRSEDFRAAYDRLEYNAALWFVLNGNGAAGDIFAAVALRPQRIYGTARVGTSVAVTVHVRLPTADKAHKFARQVDAGTHHDRQRFEYLAVTSDGDVATVALGLSPDRLRALAKSSGLMARTHPTP